MPHVHMLDVFVQLCCAFPMHSVATTGTPILYLSVIGLLEELYNTAYSTLKYVDTSPPLSLHVILRSAIHRQVHMREGCDE